MISFHLKGSGELYKEKEPCPAVGLLVQGSMCWKSNAVISYKIWITKKRRPNPKQQK